MESLGELLKKTRLERGTSLEQISKETNIAVRFLEALETENYDLFPGEPYLLGFLRTYSDSLGLDTNKVLQMYKNVCIQEQPVPLQELIPQKKFPLKLVITISSIVVVVLALVFGLIAFFNSKPSKVEEVEPVREPVEYTLDSKPLKKRFFAGDTILVKVADQTYKLSVAEAAPVFKLTTPSGDQVVQMAEDAKIDIDGDDQLELGVYVTDLFKNDPSRGAEVTLSLIDDQTQIVLADEAEPMIPTVASTSSSKQTVIFESGNPYPFTMNATFRGFCLFRYESDRKERVERYWHKSEKLPITSNNRIRLWMSNSNAVKISIIGGGRTVDLEVGKAGEVLVQDIKWVKEENGRYKLVVVNID